MDNGTLIEIVMILVVITIAMYDLKAAVFDGIAPAWFEHICVFFSVSTIITGAFFVIRNFLVM